VFQKGKQINCNFSGRANDIVKQNPTDSVFISNTESMHDLSKPEECILKHLVLYGKQIIRIVTLEILLASQSRERPTLKP